MNRNLNKIILCIGTSDCIGDSLGPMVGEHLYNNINKSNIYIYGNLKNNITYKNINIILNKLNTQIKRHYIILVDSALSNKNYIGKIIVSKNKMVIGGALDKQNYQLGDLSIKGIVGENKYNCIENYDELNNVSMKLIKKLSSQISNKILRILNV